MKHLKYFLLLLIVACSSPKIVYDYDTQEDFTTYKTFNFFSDAGKGLNDFDIKRIESIIENTLNKQGLKLSETPDFYINYSAKEVEKEEDNNVGVGIGGGNGGFGIGVSTGISLGAEKILQQLTVDFVSAKEDQLFWQSISESLIKLKAKPEEKTKHYQSLLPKVFSEFPPKKKQ
ncbi:MULTISPECIES: DUF4136 domain-containing protein [Tenacibaculum]|uniref:DUF4136 domain-containing protein n=1 Tax=Tenacibaculum TaxID=104267 RepID=UPI001F0A4A69|nr:MULTISPECIES: DUF4136 domain-containing protein [Tenacibaculum]MCH3881850.1 DUF4136 domain-containing protein [Tenacibaculum aquimarinum]MCH3885905.1 DUF4136 domain-containing protein [Tenacibaculum aquimarinum]MCH3885917.1 DUF4136 domain-containing protein [Tenacibaculum aquimarinum]MDO6598581.1 DUF4136 domain-containing protein [Tenacibaculum sp. 1_MG-2023]